MYLADFGRSGITGMAATVAIVTSCQIESNRNSD